MKFHQVLIFVACEQSSTIHQDKQALQTITGYAVAIEPTISDDVYQSYT